MTRYYSTQRPVVPGSFPKPAENKILGIKNFDKRTYCAEIKREAWGYIEYEHALSMENAADYELVKEFAND